MGVVSAMTLLSRVFGLFRDIFITAVFGASLLNSAFTAAFTLPSLFRRLLGEGALAAALMPNLSEEMERSGREGVFTLINKTLSWLAVICVALAVGSYFILDWIEESSVLENRILGAQLAKLVFPYVIPVCMAAVVSAVLNMLGRFAVPAMTAVWLNCAMIASLALGGYFAGESPMQKMYFLCLGVLVGGLLQFLAPSIALIREGWRPRVDFGVSDRLKAVLFLTLPGVYGTASHQLNVMVSRFLALDFNESGATLIYLANRLVELPLGIFTIAISTVVFPALSQSIAKGNGEDYAAMFRKGVSLTLMLTVPAAVGLSLLAPEIIATLFQRGAFSSDDSMALAPILVICAIGMPFYSFVSIETRAFYSIKDAKTPVKGSTIALLVNIVLSLSLLRLLNRIEALVIASNTAIVVQAVYMHVQLRKRQSVQLRAVAPSIVKYGVGSLALLAVVLLGKMGFEGTMEAGRTRSAIELAVLIPLGSLAYFSVLKLMKMTEVEEILATLRTRGRTNLDENDS